MYFYDVNVCDRVQTATLESYGLSMEDFEAGVTKFANSERLRAAVTRMQVCVSICIVIIEYFVSSHSCR